MEISVVVFVLLLIWWFASNQKVKRQQLQESLENWEYDDRDPPFESVWRVNFPTMRMVATFDVTEYPGDTLRTEYVIRRCNDGRWQMKFTDKSLSKLLAKAQNDVAKDAIGATVMLKELQESGEQWKNLSDKMAPSLETAYQRYVHNAV